MSHLHQEENDTAATWILKLALYCTANNSEEKRDFISSSASVTVSEVKEYVEKEYQIPAHCQSLYFESTLLRDEDILSQSWIREDCITIKYDTDADVDDIDELVATLKVILKAVESYYQTLVHTGSVDFYFIISEADIKRASNLIFKVFKIKSKRSDANRLLFVRKGGIEALFNIYDIILQIDYDKTVFRVRYLECVLTYMIGRALVYPCTMIPVLKQLVLENPTLDCVSKSFTRVLIPHKQRIVAPKLPKLDYINQSWNDKVLRITIQESQVNISNLAELPEYQIKIASNDVVMQQMFSTAFSPSSDFVSSYMAVGTLDFLSKHNDATHVYLTSPTIINNALSIYRHQQRQGYSSKTEFQLDIMVLKSLMGSFFSALISCSFDIIPLPFKGKIYHFLENFLQDADHILIKQRLDKYGYICTNLLPAISLPYFSLEPVNPQYNPRHSAMIIKLRELCLEFGVLAIQYELLGEYEKTDLVQNGLLDFVVCLPWVVPAGTKAYSRARAVLLYLNERMLLQPPSLINIARAKLAKMYFGLKRTLTLSVHELVHEYHNSAGDTCFDIDHFSLT